MALYPPSTNPIGILAAMPQEVKKLKDHVQNQIEHDVGQVFNFITGTLNQKPVVFGAANVGTAFAASAATIMALKFQVTAIIFTGVAGGLLENQKIGDIIVGKDVVNYDMDCRSFTYDFDPDYKLKLGELPFLNWIQFTADSALLALAKSAPVPEGRTLHVGRIATGSIFIDAEKKISMRETHWKHLDYPAACDMENAAVAQICRAFGVPYISLRALSDLITGDATGDFNKFCQEVADALFPVVSHVVGGYASEQV